MRLTILLTAGVMISSAFALPASPPSSQSSKADGKSTLLRRDVRTVLLNAYTFLEQIYGRYVRWQLQRHEPKLHDDDIVLIIAPNGEEVHMTLKQRRAVDSCRALMSKRKASKQEIFDQCREYAMNPELGIEDLDYTPSGSGADPIPEHITTQHHEHDHVNNNHFSEGAVQQGRRLVQTFGENVKNTIPKVLAPLAAAKAKNEKGGLITPPGDVVGSLGVPRMPRMALPL